MFAVDSMGLSPFKFPWRASKYAQLT